MVIRTLQMITDESHCDCFVFAKELLIKIEVEIKGPRICQRQRFRQNTVGIGQTNPGQMVQITFESMLQSLC